MVEISGAQRVEPGQTEMPPEWRRMAAYLIKSDSVLILKEIRRGDPQPAPNRLALQRRLFELRNRRDFLSQRIDNLAPWGDFEFPDPEQLGGQRFWFFQVPHHQMKDVEKTDLRWEVVDGLAGRIRRHLRPLYSALGFSGVVADNP